MYIILNEWTRKNIVISINIGKPLMLYGTVILSDKLIFFLNNISVHINKSKNLMYLTLIIKEYLYMTPHQEYNYDAKSIYRMLYDFTRVRQVSMAYLVTFDSYGNTKVS